MAKYYRLFYYPQVLPEKFYQLLPVVSQLEFPNYLEIVIGYGKKSKQQLLHYLYNNELPIPAILTIISTRNRPTTPLLSYTNNELAQIYQTFLSAKTTN